MAADIPELHNVGIPFVARKKVLAVHAPFKTKNVIVAQLKLRLLINSNVVNAYLVRGLAGKSIVIERVELDAANVLVVDESIVDPRLACVADLYVVLDCCE